MASEEEIWNRLSELTRKQLEARLEEIQAKRGLPRPTLLDPSNPEFSSSPVPLDLGEDAQELEIIKEILGYNTSS